jgi:hypothetical protein
MLQLRGRRILLRCLGRPLISFRGRALIVEDAFDVIVSKLELVNPECDIAYPR